MEREAAGAWVQVVCSNWAEPFGLVAAEGLMRGTAVIASKCGGLQDIVEHEVSGLLVPPGDAAALAGALKRLLGDREMAERMGAAGRKAAQARFAASVCLDQLERVYTAMIASGAGRLQPA